MPCIRTGHVHVWNTAGELTIERCEKECGFCGKSFKHAWFVRRHVVDVHRKEFPLLTVNSKWTGSPSGNRKAGNARANGHQRNTSSLSTISVGSDASVPGTVMESIETPDFTNGVPFDYSFGVDGVEMPAVPFPEMPMPVVETADPLSLSDPVLPPWDDSWLADAGVYNTSPPSAAVSGEAWVTPQHARTCGIWIESALPAPDHHGMAQHVATSLNDLVSSVMMAGGLTDNEILHVLETFTDSFRWGIGSPFPEHMLAALSETFPSPEQQF